MAKSLALVIGMCMLLAVGSASAQQLAPYDNATVRDKISSPNIDLYYSGGADYSAEKVIRLAEQALYEVSNLLDHKPLNRFRLVYYPQSWALMYSHDQIGFPYKDPGVFNMPAAYGSVVNPGTSRGLYQNIKRALARQILEDFLKGENMNEIVKDQFLMYTPIWFVEGLSDYAAEGWTFEDDVQLSAIPLGDLLQLAVTGEGKSNRLVRKSIWHYIIEEYGEQKVSEILYLAGISHSIESGIISVLGITMQSFTGRWMSKTKIQVARLQTGRDEISEWRGAEEIKLPDGYDLYSYAYNEPQNTLALYLGKMGKIGIYDFDISADILKPTEISSGYHHPHFGYLDFNLPMAWDDEGDVLAAVSWKNERLNISLLSGSRGKPRYLKVPGRIERINSISWAHESNRLLVSAWTAGSADLFVVDVRSGRFEPVLEDGFDNIHASWGYDDSFILFSSNRDSSSLNLEGEDLEGYSRTFDLFKMEMPSGKLEALTLTPTINELQPNSPNSYEVIFTSDESGIPSLSRYNYIIQELTPLSNFSSGVLHFDIREPYAILMSSGFPSPSLFFVPMQDMGTIEPPGKSHLRLRYDQEYAQKQRILKAALEQSAREKIAAEERANQVAPEPEVVEYPEEVVEEEEEKKSPVRYYIFDEEEEPYEVRRPNRNFYSDRIETQTATITNAIFGKMAEPELDDIQVSSPINATNPWKLDYAKGFLHYDPILGHGLKMSAGLSDLRGDHFLTGTVRPYFNFKNLAFDLGYEYRKNRMDLLANVTFSSVRYRIKDEQPSAPDVLNFRFLKLGVDVGLRYPFSSSLALTGTLGYYYLQRVDLNLQQPSPADATDNALRGMLELKYDDTRQRELFTISGTRASLSFESVYSAGQKSLAFSTVRGEVAYYFQINNSMVLATRFMGAFSVPTGEQRFYLGGPDEMLLDIGTKEEGVNGSSAVEVDTGLYAFQFRDYVMPVRGFSPLRRIGSRYLLLNVELRIPLSKALSTGLNSNALFNLELIPFLDVGTTWDTGNPFSQKNPTDTRILSKGSVVVKLQTLRSPFLLGMGAGLRTNIAGYSLRFDLGVGVEDMTVKQPRLTLTAGKNF